MGLGSAGLQRKVKDFLVGFGIFRKHALLIIFHYKSQKGGFYIRKIICLLWIFLLFPSITWAEEKVEAPVWNVGDKWFFTQGNIEVVGSDQNSYTLTFSKATCRAENKGLEKIMFDKLTLNRIYALMDDKREKYAYTQRRILNFPFNPGKKWTVYFLRADQEVLTILDKNRHLFASPRTPAIKTCL